MANGTGQSPVPSFYTDGNGSGSGGSAGTTDIPINTGPIEGPNHIAVCEDLNNPAQADACDASNPGGLFFFSRCIGFYTGTPGKIRNSGLVTDAPFTTAGGQPNNGDPVYLCQNADDGGGSAGKLTATPPVASGASVAPVGVCIDNTAYAGSKKCSVLIQILPLTVNP